MRGDEQGKDAVGKGKETPRPRGKDVQAEQGVQQRKPQQQGAEPQQNRRSHSRQAELKRHIMKKFIHQILRKLGLRPAV